MNDPIQLHVPLDWVPISPSADPLAKPVRLIRADGAGTVTVTVRSGASRVMRFAAGETRMVYATHVTAATASNLEGGV